MIPSIPYISVSPEARVSYLLAFTSIRSYDCFCNKTHSSEIAIEANWSNLSVQIRISCLSSQN